MATTHNFIVLFWLIPVLLQIVLPIFFLAGFGIYQFFQAARPVKKMQSEAEGVEASFEVA